MPVIVTRPEQEARQLVQRLQDRGIAARALPLIAIGGAPDPQSLVQAWQGLAQFRAAMFVSGNAAREFCACRPADAVFDTRAWTTGPGTRDALVQCGVPADRIDMPPADAAQFDSEALWAVVRPQVRAGDRVLIVRGGDADGQASGRDWLRDQLVAAGAQPDTVVAYVRGLPSWDAAQRADAAAGAGDGSVWLFSSSEAVANLKQLLPGQSWAGSKAVATHPRIAQAVRSAGFGVVQETRPPFEAVLAALESIR